MYGVAPLFATANCVPRVVRNTSRHCELSGACATARDDWLQYIGMGDWWASHISLERLVGAMLDDSFSIVGSVGFDVLMRLFMGSKPALAAAQSNAEQAQDLKLHFVKLSPHWKKLPHYTRHRIESEGGLSAEEAACAAAFLTEAIVAAENDDEQRKWMEAVMHAAGPGIPPAESPFTLHSSVYPQLVRGWPTYSGNQTAVFTSARSPGSSGVDRLTCERRRSENEHSNRNVDAGEFKTLGYKSPHEVEGVMVSPPPAHPGVGRRRRLAASTDAQPQAFHAAFPTTNSSYEEIASFERRWSKKDILQFPMPFEPPALSSAFFRVRHHLLPVVGSGSMVAVLAPSEGVRSIQPARSGPGFVVSNDAMRESDSCVACQPAGKRCFSEPTDPSEALVPVAGMLFRCSYEMFRTLGMLDGMRLPSQLAAEWKRLERAPAEHATLCCASQLLREMHSLTSDQVRVGAGSSPAARWSAELIDRLRRIRLRSPHAVVNLHDPQKSLMPPADSLCALSLESVLQMDGLIERAGWSSCSSSCTWGQLHHDSNSSKATGRLRLPEVERQRAPRTRSNPSPAHQPVDALHASCPGMNLSVCKCDALLGNRQSILSRMWSKTGWVVLHDGTEGGGPCWGSGGERRSFFESLQDGAESRSACRQTNWYGRKIPRFTANAPGLLGFDDAIKHHCLTINRAQRRGNDSSEKRKLGRAEQECPVANRNILSMDDSLYNSCQNVRWQVCAARGQVHGQTTPQIVFAVAPSKVPIGGSLDDELPSLMQLDSNITAYDQASIFFLEVCTYSVLCKNNAELFRLSAGELFTCEVSPQGIRRLQAMLIEANQA